MDIMGVVAVQVHDDSGQPRLVLMNVHLGGRLHANIALKPLRFAFLVPATDRQSILDAIET